MIISRNQINAQLLYSAKSLFGDCLDGIIKFSLLILASGNSAIQTFRANFVGLAVVPAKTQILAPIFSLHCLHEFNNIELQNKLTRSFGTAYGEKKKIGMKKLMSQNFS